jgi:iron complex outermembrane receptor protein
VFGDLMYSATQTYSQLNAQPTTTSAAAADPTNPFDVAVVARNRFLDHPRQYFYDTTNIRGVIGVRGQINDAWGYEAAALNNKITQDYRNPGLIDTNARIAAVGGGVLNYFAREQVPGAVTSSGMFGTALGQAVSELETYDARVNGSLFNLPAGELGFAAGVEWRVEKLTQTADRNSQGETFGWDTATTLDPFNTDRDVNAFFANVRVPILGSPDGKGMSLTAEVAVRHEIYSDTDDPTVPKYQLSWHPINEEFLVRATYSESFAAPTLFNLFGPGGIGFTPSLLLDSASGGTISGQANARSGSNPGLLPATSKNYTFGMVWSPKSVKGLSFTVDYFDIKQDGLISTIGSEVILQDVELAGTASPYASMVRFGPRNNTSMFENGTPVTGIGQISGHAIDEVYVTDTLVNISWQKLNGVDFKVDYTWNSDTLGRFDTSLAGIWWNTYEYQALPDSPVLDTVGQATTFNGTIPEFQTYAYVAWTRGKLGAFLGWTYIPSVNDVNWYDDTDSTADENVEAFNSVDVSASYTFGSETKWLNGFTIKIGANNVFNESPPMAKGTFTDANADTATYGAIGRFMYVEGKYRF